MKIQILGIKINQISLNEIIGQINGWTKSNHQHYIATINPEFVVAAQKNNKFKDTLNNADIATCDGVGLVLAGLFLRGKKLIRVTGVEIVKILLKSNPSTNELKIYLLGGEEGTAQTLIKKYPQTNIVGAERGGRINTKNWQLENNQEVIDKINNSDANVLLVGFGQVKQEMWIYHNLDKLPNIKTAIGVGGTYDYLSSKIKRAPSWMRKLGLEWLFRLIKQPQRAGRIFNATIKFSWLVLMTKLKIHKP